MKKPDEIKFLQLLQREGWAHAGGSSLPGRTMPRRLIAREASWLNEKRALAILDKWTACGWYDYGTVIDGGWLTEKGLSVMV